VDPVPDPLLLRNLVVPGLEPGPLNLWPRTLNTIPQRRSVVIVILAVVVVVVGVLVMVVVVVVVVVAAAALVSKVK
jgi:hypothetical protein